MSQQPPDDLRGWIATDATIDRGRIATSTLAGVAASGSSDALAVSEDLFKKRSLREEGSAALVASASGPAGMDGDSTAHVRSITMSFENSIGDLEAQVVGMLRPPPKTRKVWSSGG